MGVFIPPWIPEGDDKTNGPWKKQMKNSKAATSGEQEA